MSDVLTPFFAGQGVTLYRGDARDVLPLLPAASVDVVLTDPPYNIGSPQRVSDQRTADRRLVGGDFGTFDEGAVTPAEWMPLVLRLLKPGGVVVSFYQARAMDQLLGGAKSAGFEVVQDFHWCKSNPPVPMRSIGFSWGVESGYVFRRAGERHTPNQNHGVSPNWFRHPICSGNERSEHPTQKPEAVIAWLLRHWSFPGWVVLDPFLGSGTTAKVGRDMGCDCIGVESDAAYCDIAVRRLSQSPLFS